LNIFLLQQKVSISQSKKFDIIIQITKIILNLKPGEENMKKFYNYGLSIVLCAMLTNGCAAMIVGAGGTALWQQGKIVSEEPKTLAQVQAAAEQAIKHKKIVLNDTVARDNFVQLRGKGPDGEKIAIDIIETAKNASRIEIRVGIGKKQAAKDLLLEIKKNLYAKPGFKLF